MDPPSVKAADLFEEAMMLKIQATNLHWLDKESPESDLCAHGGVIVRDASRVLIDDSRESWTLSAAVLYLLRTLDCDHTPAAPIAGHLMPCCGHAMYDQGEGEDVAIVGCPNGRDWQVVHQGDAVVLDFGEGERVSVPKARWVGAILGFSEVIEAFYRDSAPKRPLDEVDAAGFEAFRREWARRIEAARLIS